MTPVYCGVEITTQIGPDRFFYVIVRPPEAVGNSESRVLKALRGIHGVLYADSYPGGAQVQTMFRVTTVSEELFPQDQMHGKAIEAVRLALEGRERPSEELPPLKLVHEPGSLSNVLRVVTNRQLRGGDQYLIERLVLRLNAIQGVEHANIDPANSYAAELWLHRGGEEWAEHIYNDADRILAEILKD